MAANIRFLPALLTLLTVCLVASSAMPMLLIPSADPPMTSRTMDDDPYNATISATVLDEVGRPIEGATVSINDSLHGETTDEHGVAVFTNLFADPNGTGYSLSASKTGYLSLGDVDATVTPGNLTEVELRIRGGLIIGFVSDSAGAVVGATVSVPTLGYSTTTSADGGYSIAGVPGSMHPYAVTVTATGYMNQTKEVVLETGGHAVLSFTLVSLTGSISGNVRHAGTSEPLAGVSVSVRVTAVTVMVSTDGNGSYEIPDLPSGTYTVSADKEGFEPASVSDVTVVSGSETEGVDFLMDEKPTRLFGVVRAGTFLLPGVTITVLGTGFSANTSIDGEYEIRNVTAGTYNIVASREGYITTTVVGVVIPRGGEVQLNLNMTGLPGSLFGLVLSSETMEPLANVEVTIMGLGVHRSTVSNVNGEFEFTGLPSGNYTVRLVADEYRPKEIGPFVLTQDATVRLDQVLMTPLRESLGGFIFGFDLAHSMMIMALFLTIIILALAVLLRVRTFESPDKAPAVYDQEDDEEPPGTDEEEPDAEPEKGPDRRVERPTRQTGKKHRRQRRPR